MADVAERPRLGGYLPDAYDEADIRFTSSVTPKDSVNLAAAHPTWLQEVYNQQVSNSCVANGTAGAFRYLAHMTNEKPHQLTHLFKTEPSRLFIYYNARQLPFIQAGREPVIADQGSCVRDGMKSLKKFGVCSEDTWPFLEDPNNHRVQHINEKPLERAYEEAAAVHVLQYSRLDPDYPDKEEPNATLQERDSAGATTLHNLKQCLTEGYPATFGFNYYWEEPPWEKAGDGLKLLPKLHDDQRHHQPPRDKNGKSFGGHCVLAIGYDDKEKSVLCQNSWDKTWSKGGLFWIKYDWITDWEATNDFWTLRVIQND